MNNETNPPALAKTPSHIAYQVTELKAGKSKWTEIGTVWPHADGKGSTLLLDVLPFERKIVIRAASGEQK